MFLSAVIRSLRLDQTDPNFDLDKLISKINTDGWLNDAKDIFSSEAKLFSIHGSYSEEKIEKVFRSIQNYLTNDEIKKFVHTVYANSIAQMIFLAGSTTSGSLLNDLSYQISESNNEILLFDSVNVEMEAVSSFMIIC